MLTRRKVLATGAAAATATLAMPHIARAAGKMIEMRLSHAANPIHPGHIAAVEFKKELEKRLPGRVHVKIFPNRQLGTDKQNLEAAIAGTNQLCGCSGILYPLVTGRPALDAWQLPFLIKDYDHFAKLAVSNVSQKILDDLLPAGLVGLQVTDIGRRHFLSVKSPVTKLADFKGLKTRIVPVPLHKAIWNAVGVSPVGLAYGEVYGALQTKVIDAVEINVSSMLGENLWEVGKNFTLTGHYPWHNVIAMNRKFFESQEKKVQEAIREAGSASVAATLAYTSKQDHDGRAELMKKGVKIYKLSELDLMKKKVEPLVAKWSKRSPLIAEFVKLAQS
jgi:tripartite ATP-independent transporter DctP family solute receptor